MGRGDKRTKRGKISMGSFGVSRPARVITSKTNTAAANTTVAASAKKA